MPEAPATVALLGGTGDLGQGLSLRLSRAGVEVIIGSRDGERAVAAARRVSEAVPGGAVRGAELADAASSASMVFVCVPFAVQAATLKGIKGALNPGTVVVDASVPLAAAVGGRPTQTVGVWAGSAGQQAAALLGGAGRVVSGLHTIGAAHLADLDHPLGEDALICGDDPEAKAATVQVLERIDGLRVVDCGPLEAARLLEGITPLLIGLNIRNKARTGIRVTGLS